VGVEFLSCARCDETFPDCGHYVTCYQDHGDHCSRSWCSHECAELDGFQVNEESVDDETSCNYCRGENAEDGELFRFLMKKHRTTRAKVLIEWKAARVKKRKTN
jgi:hypothetical protein